MPLSFYITPAIGGMSVTQEGFRTIWTYAPSS